MAAGFRTVMASFDEGLEAEADGALTVGEAAEEGNLFGNVSREDTLIFSREMGARPRPRARFVAAAIGALALGGVGLAQISGRNPSTSRTNNQWRPAPSSGIGMENGVVMLSDEAGNANAREIERALIERQKIKQASSVPEADPDESEESDAAATVKEKLTLDKAVTTKTTTAIVASDCFGFEECPKFPTPFVPPANGELMGIEGDDFTYPQTYNYGGSFPRDFVWGYGTASYQIEGAYNEDGRGASIWDTFTGADTTGMPGGDCSYCCKKAPCPINPAMYDKGATGNVATDHYHNYKADVALMKSQGLRHYRFSVAWPRVVPTGKVKDGVNQKAIDFYNNLIDELLQAGITPYVTIFHWDLPQALFSPPEMQGWWARDESGKPTGQITQDYVDFADICFKNFGDRVKTWVTFNEAWTLTFLASGFGKAPSIKEFSNMSIDPYIAGHNVLNAHAEAVHLYRTKYKATQGGQIGITNNCDWREPKSNTNADIAASERALLTSLGWFSDPIFYGEGDYPAPMRTLYGDRLPTFTAEQKKKINGSADFFGLNHYGTGWVQASEEPGADTAYAKVTHDGFVQGSSVWLFGSGWGFRKLLNWIDQRYHHPPIFVTEGGWSTVGDDVEEAVKDTSRALYYANYTAAMRNAIYEDKVDVRGYFAWSLMDNFEWERGYAERFGTTFSDYSFGKDPNAPTNADHQPTREGQYHRRKESSCFLEQVSRANALLDPLTFPGCPDSSVFNNTFYDSLQPRCKRVITVKSATTGTLTGTAPTDGAQVCNGDVDKEFGPFDVKLSGGTIRADIVKNSEMVGYWNDAVKAINWGDGSMWEALQPVGLQMA